MQHCRGFEETANWTFYDQKTCLENGMEKIRFEHYLNRNRQIQNMRSVQSHPGGQRIDPKLWNHVLILHD